MSVRNASLSIYYGNIDAQKWSLVSVNSIAEGLHRAECGLLEAIRLRFELRVHL